MQIHYALLGGGRLGRHLRHYLQRLDLPCSGWARDPSSAFNSHGDPDPLRRLRLTIEPASHVLLLVPDDAIAGLLRRYPVLHTRPLVHCAGALSLPGVAAAHPLMTFADGPFYSLDEYRATPFVLEPGRTLEEVLPGLPNPVFHLDPAQKALYHALCVVAGNLPQLLWSAVSERFDGTLGLPAEALGPYLRRVLENSLEDPVGAPTGPIVRGDAQTISRNLTALGDDPLGSVYRAVAALARRESEAAPLRREARS